MSLAEDCYLLTLFDRHRKPAIDANGNKSSPRKALPTDGSFGTIF